MNAFIERIFVISLLCARHFFLLSEDMVVKNNKKFSSSRILYSSAKGKLYQINDINININTYVFIMCDMNACSKRREIQRQRKIP